MDTIDAVQLGQIVGENLFYLWSWIALLLFGVLLTKRWVL